MQLRMSPGGSIPNSLRRTPELPPSSVTVTIAPRAPTDHAPSQSTYVFSPRRSVERPVPPPMATMFNPGAGIAASDYVIRGGWEPRAESRGHVSLTVLEDALDHLFLEEGRLFRERCRIDGAVAQQQLHLAGVGRAVPGEVVVEEAV